MKKIILFALAVMPQAYSQCTEPFTVPYEMDTESLAVPALPDCSTSYYNSFASQEQFQTIAGPVAGYSGNVLAYSTATSEFMPPEAWVSAVLYSPGLQLQQGISYTVSYKYGNSDAQLSIDGMTVAVSGANGGQVTVAEHMDITGAVATQHTSSMFTVPVSGSYQINFSVYTTGTQGLLYLDDVKVEEVPTMGLSGKDKSLATIYPNPVKDLLHLNNSSDLDKVTIYNMAGQVVMSKDNILPLSTLDMGRFAEGIYLAELINGNSREMIKVIKE